MSRLFPSMAATAGGRSVARRLAAAVLLVGFIWPPVALAQDAAPVSVTEEGGVYYVAASFTIAEAATVAHAALTDYPHIPRFMPEVRVSEVRERTAAHVVVEQEAVASFMLMRKRVHLVLEIQEAPGSIRFVDRCGQSFARYEGAWIIAERGGATHITYELAAKPTFDVPEFLLKRLFKRDADRMIARLRGEISARARLVTR